PISDDGERCAETEIATQPGADLLVRQPRARGVDDGAEQVLRLRFGRSRQAVERLVDLGARACLAPTLEALDVLAHHLRVGAFDVRALARVFLDLVRIDADDTLLAAVDATLLALCRRSEEHTSEL